MEKILLTLETEITKILYQYYYIMKVLYAINLLSLAKQKSQQQSEPCAWGPECPVQSLCSVLKNM